MNDTLKTENKYNFKHLLFGPAGPFGLSYYGIMKHCLQHNIVNMDNIISLHGISIGSVVSVVLCLDYDNDDLDDYFIQRPWNKAYESNLYTMLNSINACGIYDKKFFITLLSPLLKGKDLDITITMKDFYHYCNKQLYIYSIHGLSLDTKIFSAENTPDVELIDAIHASCCIPGLFVPCKIDDVIYFDGGIRLQLPIDNCIELMNIDDSDTILALRVKNTKEQVINTDNIFYFLFSWVYIIVMKFVLQQRNVIKYVLTLDVDGSKTMDLSEIINSKTYRMELMNRGMEYAKSYFS